MAFHLDGPAGLLESVANNFANGITEGDVGDEAISEKS
jgi:hypothetical protein